MRAFKENSISTRCISTRIFQKTIRGAGTAYFPAACMAGMIVAFRAAVG